MALQLHEHRLQEVALARSLGRRGERDLRDRSQGLEGDGEEPSDDEAIVHRSLGERPRVLVSEQDTLLFEQRGRRNVVLVEALDPERDLVLQELREPSGSPPNAVVGDVCTPFDDQRHGDHR
ncbi:MAG: hypothetical protein HC923_08275, partial [Myxococcales bacterium]|nr:hypothetical protein [Myxococcales bacterium]